MRKSIMKSTQRGITLMETMGAMAIGAIMMVGLIAMIDTSMEDSKGQQAAFYHSQVTAAARRYIAANNADLLSKTPTPKVVAIDVGELINQKFLPSNFSLTNGYGQSTCVLVRQPTPVAPGSQRLDALVVASGGKKIEDKLIASVALNAGQGSGYITAANTGLARGPSWSMPTTIFRNVPCPNGGAQPVLDGSAADGGHLVSSLFSDGPGLADYLYRDEIPGRPELNRMNAPIRMADKAEVIEGTPCGTLAAIAVNNARDLMRCGSDGNWTTVASTWKNPVANFVSLPGTDKHGDVRMTLDKNRAFVFNGASWVALAVDDAGNFNVPQDLTVGRDAIVTRDVRATGDVYGRDVNATRDIQAGNDISATRDVLADRDVRATHDVIADHDVRAANDVRATRDVNAGRNMSAANNITAAKEVRGIETVRGNYITADAVVETPELYLVAPTYKASANCHIPVIVNGKTEHILPIGTVVLDQNGLMLICATDRKLRYPNGTFDP
jgi:Tfp pilus assembly protein PilE